MAKILAIDLDGTLFYPKGKKRLVSKKNVAFLQKFIDAGNKVVLISSRSPLKIKEAIKEIDRPVDYLAHSGAVWELANGYEIEKSLSNTMLEQVLASIQVKYKPIAYFLSCKDSPVVVRPFIKIGRFLTWLYNGVYKLKLGIYREPIVVGKHYADKELKGGTVYDVKAFFGLGRKTRKINKQINKAIREKYPSIESSWMGIVLEFAPKGCSKGESLSEYIDYLHADKNDVYVIGDSGNDISMFNAFHEHSFCMKHGYPSVKKYAKYKVSRVYKLEKYLFERSQNE